MSEVTFLGLGAMGSRMAANLLKAAHHLTVWNREPQAADRLVAMGAKSVLFDPSFLKSEVLGCN
jgi:3-hydroxyisobutyrate dehydrogenase-like beta-hydroxyacid dehydrogenase